MGIQMNNWLSFQREVVNDTPPVGFKPACERGCESHRKGKQVEEGPGVGAEAGCK